MPTVLKNAVQNIFFLIVRSYHTHTLARLAYDTQLPYSDYINLGRSFLTAWAPLKIRRKYFILTSETIPLHSTIHTVYDNIVIFGKKNDFKQHDYVVFNILKSKAIQKLEQTENIYGERHVIGTFLKKKFSTGLGC